MVQQKVQGVDGQVAQEVAARSAAAGVVNGQEAKTQKGVKERSEDVTATSGH